MAPDEPTLLDLIPDLELLPDDFIRAAVADSRMILVFSPRNERRRMWPEFAETLRAEAHKRGIDTAILDDTLVKVRLGHRD